MKETFVHSFLHFFKLSFQGNWYDAILRCRLMRMHPVSIHSKEKNDFIAKLVKSGTLCTAQLYLP